MPRARLLELVTFQQEGTTDDGGGGQSAASWAAVSGLTEVAAAVAPMFGREGAQADQVQSVDRYRVTIRRNPDALPQAKYRILWISNGSKVLNIVSAPDHGPRSQNVELHCEAGGGH